MTHAQASAYAAAIHREERRRRRNAVVDARAAIADEKSFTKYLRSLGGPEE
jgi:hypothetical protein